MIYFKDSKLTQNGCSEKAHVRLLSYSTFLVEIALSFCFSHEFITYVSILKIGSPVDHHTNALHLVTNLKCLLPRLCSNDARNVLPFSLLILGLKNLRRPHLPILKSYKSRYEEILCDFDVTFTKRKSSCFDIKARALLVASRVLLLVSTNAGSSVYLSLVKTVPQLRGFGNGMDRPVSTCLKLWEPIASAHSPSYPDLEAQVLTPTMRAIFAACYT